MEKLEIKFSVSKGRKIIIDGAFASCDITAIGNADTGLSVDEQLEIITNKIKDKVLEKLEKDAKQEELIRIIESNTVSRGRKLKAIEELANLVEGRL